MDHWRVNGRWILSWPWNVGQRSLKVIEISAIWKLGCSLLFPFYSNYSRLCTCVRYSVSKNGVTLKTRLEVVQDHWKWRRSINHYATFYWSAIVNIALYCAIFELFDVENIVTLKSGLEVTQCHWSWPIRKLGCGLLFAFYSNYGRICSRLWDI